MLTAAVADPLREGAPPGWREFGAEVGLPALWDPEVLAGLAWYGQHPLLLGAVLDGGRPAAVFSARHWAPSQRFAPSRRRLVGLVECCLPPGISSAGHAFHPDLDTAGRAAALTAFERAARRRLGVRCTAVAYRQVAEDELPAFRRRGRVIRPAVPEAVVHNEWSGFDDFLAALPIRHRKKLRRLRQSVTADPAVVQAVEARVPAREASRLAAAIVTRYRPHHKPFPPVPPLWYELLSDRDSIRYFTYRDRAGRLLADSMLVDDGRALRCLVWGALPESEGGRRDLYFDHYLRQIEYLIEHGRARMAMGKGMWELKERFGARLTPLYAALSVAP